MDDAFLYEKILDEGSKAQFVWSYIERSFLSELKSQVANYFKILCMLNSCNN